jgi:hypothetical protein
MRKGIISAVLTLMMTVAWVGTSYALDEGNKRKGKYTYRKVYKACMQRGEVDSEKPPVNPADKKQAEWTAFFTKLENNKNSNQPLDTENDIFKEFGCMEEWSQLTDEKINDIYAYLYNHAADSATPATCK